MKRHIVVIAKELSDDIQPANLGESAKIISQLCIEIWKNMELTLILHCPSLNLPVFLLYYVNIMQYYFTITPNIHHGNLFE